MLWWIASLAYASPCPSLSEQVSAARNAFDEAETEQARQILSDTYDALACQESVVPTRRLVEFYQLDALAAMVEEDEKGAVYAMIRSVAADPSALPASSAGPELRELQAQWAENLGKTTVEITIADGGQGWIDGKELSHDTALTVIAGEHLLQWKDDRDSLNGEVRTLSADFALETGVELEGEAVADSEDLDDEDSRDDRSDDQDDRDDSRDDRRGTKSSKGDEREDDRSSDDDDRRSDDDDRRSRDDRDNDEELDDSPRGKEKAERGETHKTGGGGGHGPGAKIALGVTGAAIAGGGGVSLLLGWFGERNFAADPYDADSYGGCAQGRSCYDTARETEIRRDARNVRLMYGLGYGLIGAGVVVGGVGVAAAPAQDGGLRLTLSGKW